MLTLSTEFVSLDRSQDNPMAFLHPSTLSPSFSQRSTFLHSTTSVHVSKRPADLPSRSSIRMDLPSKGVYDPSASPADIRAVVFGATGYIGRVVTQEFLEKGFAVTAFSRPKSGVSGKDTASDLETSFPNADIVLGDVTNPEDLPSAFEKLGAKGTVAVSCLASRTGGIADSQRIDYQATSDVLRAARAAGVKHFVLLSAVCVQKPELEFQRQKLRFEAELEQAAKEDEEFSYSVVRPTAFFKSLAGQVERLKNGKAYIMFGDGDLSKCNALSERDLARYMIECVTNEDRRNQILRIGGPGNPVTPKEQAEMLFNILGKKEKYVKVPIGIMDAAIGGLAWVEERTKWWGGLTDAVEFAKIGRYYAVEDMVAPGVGGDTLEQFFTEAVKDGGMKGQDLGAAKVL